MLQIVRMKARAASSNHLMGHATQSTYSLESSTHHAYVSEAAFVDNIIKLPEPVSSHRQSAQPKSSLQNQFTLRHPEGRHQSFLSLADDSMLGGDGLPARAEVSMQHIDVTQQDDEAQGAQLLVVRPDPPLAAGMQACPSFYNVLTRFWHSAPWHGTNVMLLRHV